MSSCIGRSRVLRCVYILRHLGYAQSCTHPTFGSIRNNVTKPHVVVVVVVVVDIIVQPSSVPLQRFVGAETWYRDTSPQIGWSLTTNRLNIVQPHTHTHAAYFFAIPRHLFRQFFHPRVTTARSSCCLSLKTPSIDWESTPKGRWQTASYSSSELGISIGKINLLEKGKIDGGSPETFRT